MYREKNKGGVFIDVEREKEKERKKVNGISSFFLFLSSILSKAEFIHRYT